MRWAAAAGRPYSIQRSSSAIGPWVTLQTATLARSGILEFKKRKMPRRWGRFTKFFSPKDPVGFDHARACLSGISRGDARARYGCCFGTGLEFKNVAGSVAAHYGEACSTAARAVRHSGICAV